MESPSTRRASMSSIRSDRYGSTSDSFRKQKGTGRRPGESAAKRHRLPRTESVEGLPAPRGDRILRGAVSTSVRECLSTHELEASGGPDGGSPCGCREPYLPFQWILGRDVTACGSCFAQGARSITVPVAGAGRRRLALRSPHPAGRSFRVGCRCSLQAAPRFAAPLPRDRGTFPEGGTRHPVLLPHHPLGSWNVCVTCWAVPDTEARMDLVFLGAARTVTGSKTLLESHEQRLLVDCGLFQGLKELRLRNWEPPDWAPDRIPNLLLTHAHIDHSGFLPRLLH